MSILYELISKSVYIKRTKSCKCYPRFCSVRVGHGSIFFYLGFSDFRCRIYFDEYCASLPPTRAGQGPSARRRPGRNSPSPRSDVDSRRPLRCGPRDPFAVTSLARVTVVVRIDERVWGDFVAGLHRVRAQLFNVDEPPQSWFRRDFTRRGFISSRSMPT